MIKFFACFALAGLVLFASCGKDKPTPPPPPPAPQFATLEIMVLHAVDSDAVAGANVVLYNANTNQPFRRATTDAAGVASFSVDLGAYFVRISAQNFMNLPPEQVAPVPFSAASYDTSRKIYYLDSLASPPQGRISGLVRADSTDSNRAIPAVLIIAEDTVSRQRYSAVSGPDGYFVLFNLPISGYKLEAYLAAWRLPASPRLTLTASAQSAVDTLILTRNTGCRITGMVTFLSSKNSVVDVTLLDSMTFSAVPGLAVMCDSNRNYRLDRVPPGRYLLWASFKNDGYVLDPNRLFSSGYPMITVSPGDTALSKDFWVTDVVELASPTNPADSIYPVTADSVIPTFQWHSYPATHEYILEVSDLSGRVIWGGFNRADSTVRHRQLPSRDTSAVFNFDGSATAALARGTVYRWKVYADDDNAPKVQQLISSSEDLRGLFVIP